MTEQINVQVGDTVRFKDAVVMEVYRGLEPAQIEVTFDDGATDATMYESDVAEVVRRAEPEYEVDAAYVDADGEVFTRLDDDVEPWLFGRSAYSEDYPTRPLVKLVPEYAANDRA